MDMANLMNYICRIREAAKIGLAVMEHLARLEDKILVDAEEVEVLQQGGRRRPDAQVALILCIQSGLLIRTHQVVMMEAHSRTKELVGDMLTLVGQADIAVWEAREAAIYPKLDKEFVSSLKNLNKKRGGAVTRFSANRLFHEDLDSVVSKRSKEARMTRVLAAESGQFDHRVQGKQRTASSR